MAPARGHALSRASAHLRTSRPLRDLRLCRLVAACGGLLLLAAACWPLPRPFQPEYKDANPLIGVQDGDLLHVVPIARQAPGDPHWTAETLADALRSRNLAATTQHPGSATTRLTGRAVVQPINAEHEELLLYWELQNAGNGRLAAHSQRSRLPKGAWRAGDREAITPVLEDTAAAIAALLQEPTSAQVAVPGFPGARLVILPIRSAPGDGGLRLAQALAEELGKAGLPLAEHPGSRDLLIDCQVSLSPPGGYWREIRLSWAVNQAKDGRELGRIDQSNRVPADQLDGPWGALSTAIAQGAAAGILDLLDQLGPAS